MYWLLGISLLLAAADPRWEAFDAPSVDKFGCTVDNDAVLNGQPAWAATAWATRKPQSDKRPYHDLYSIRPTFEEASKDCNQWFKEARKRVHDAGLH